MLPDGPLPEQRPPGLLARLAYGVGAVLGPEHLTWVSADLTGPGWRRRQVLRTLSTFIVGAVVFALLPGGASTRAVIPVFLVLAGIVMGFATSGFTRNRKLVQHGFAPVLPPDDDEFPPG